jgi:3-dehydroquinate synthase class II
MIRKQLPLYESTHGSDWQILPLVSLVMQIASQQLANTFDMAEQARIVDLFEQ